MEKTKPISLRLDEDTFRLVENAKARGITASAYINNQIRESNSQQINADKKILTIISNMQTILEFAEEPCKSAMRKELHELCLILK